MSKKSPKPPKGLSGKLLAVEPEYRFAVYKKLIAIRRDKMSGKGSPMLPGSYDSGETQVKENRALMAPEL